MRRQKLPFLTGALAMIVMAGSLSPVDAIVRRDDVDDQQYLDFGDLFPTVGKVTSNTSLGSGVLINSRWVLTAAHLSDSGTPNAFTIADSLYTVSEFKEHPDWDGDISNGNDIALARLETPVQGITPSDWYTGSDERGMIGVSVGFGNRGTGDTGQVSGTAGTKRAAESLIARDDDAGGPGPPQPTVQVDTTLEYDFLSPDDPDVLALEGSAARGDSGGGLFVDFGEGFLVAGIHSFVLDRDGTEQDPSIATYGDSVASTRVSLYNDWIVSTIPEPGTWALWGGLVAFAAVAVWRRRS